MPKEEDLNNWSHHFSVDSVDDEYLKKATQGTGLVKFVFGLHVNWDLTQKQQALDEQRDASDKSRRDIDLKEAQSRIGEKKSKKKKITIESAGRDELESTDRAVQSIPLKAKPKRVITEMLDGYDRKEDSLEDSEKGTIGKCHGDTFEDNDNEVIGKINRVSSESAEQEAPDDQLDMHEAEKSSSDSQIACLFCTFMNSIKAKKCTVSIMLFCEFIIL
jgi:hypothetical protein